MARQKTVVFEYIEALLFDENDLLESTEPASEEIATIDAESNTESIEESVALPEIEVDTSVEPEPEPEPEPEFGSDEMSEEEIAAAMAESIESDLISVPVTAASEPEKPAVIPKPALLSSIERRPKINCILVDMHGMRLAIPAEHMENSYSFESTTISIAGLPDWIIGRVDSEHDAMHIVDTALWLIPEKYKPEFAEYKEYVLLVGGQWALACDGLSKSVKIPHDEINWNEDRTTRSWLLGTHMGERCVLLDIPALIEGFETKF